MKKFLTSRVFISIIYLDVKIFEVERGEQMFDHETRMMIANDRFEQLLAAGAQTPSAPLRLRLGNWLIRAGRRLAAELDCGEPSAFAHEALARRAH
jgi:hypothetical protein